MNSNPSVGLKAIIDVCGLADKEITVGDIVFKIGPRINASGRIQNGKEAVDLLTEKDFSTALEKAGQINQYNETRKDLDKSMTEEANRIVDCPTSPTAAPSCSTTRRGTRASSASWPRA